MGWLARAERQKAGRGLEWREGPQEERSAESGDVYAAISAPVELVASLMITESVDLSLANRAYVDSSGDHGRGQEG